MRLLIINSVCGIKSTGRIALDIAKEYESTGYEVKIAYGRENVPPEAKKYAIRIGTEWDVRIHGIKSRLFDAHGLGSKRATKTFLKWADSFNPDILWLHNIHGYYINYELLFDWIKSRPEMEVKWTLHDCWAFTGHCAHFIASGCDKWEEQCEDCPSLKEYPKSFLFDNSKDNYKRKQAAFTGVNRLTIITPSEWLKNCVKASFLKDYEVAVKKNEIDMAIFKPTPSNFKSEHGIADKKMLLGVASTWSEKKGLKDFYKLNELLPDDFVIVLVGLTAKQISVLPKGMIGIEKTNSKSELAEIYSAADIFLNLSYEETYPTVNLEAQACGTRVIAYDVGGTKETLKTSGLLISPGNIDRVAADIYGI